MSNTLISGITDDWIVQHVAPIYLQNLLSKDSAEALLFNLRLSPIDHVKACLSCLYTIDANDPKRDLLKQKYIDQCRQMTVPDLQYFALVQDTKM